MKRHGTLVLGAALAAAIGCGGGPPPAALQNSYQPPAPASPTPAKPRPPNIVLIVADDLNVALGCYGHSTARTPTIDALAGRGVRFNRAYAPFPLCNPSRSSFLTGLYPETLGVLDGTTHFRANRPNVVSLPQLLRGAGYHTIGLSKVFHDAPGMDDSGEWDESRTFTATARGQDGTGETYACNGASWGWLAADGDDLDQPDGQAARAAVDFLRRRGDQPFFLAVGMHKPHEPLVAPRKYFDLYPASTIVPPTVPADDRRDIPAVALPPACAFTAAQSRSLLRAYYACVSFVDTQVATVLDALESEGIRDQTVVVFLGDNGLHLGEHGHWGKATLFEPAARVPLIIAGPGVTATGRVSPRPVDLTSLFATLADLAGAALPQGVEGPSLAPLLSDPQAAWGPAYTFCKPTTVKGRSVRDEHWRYTEWGFGAGGQELYDEDADPDEWTNRADDPAYTQSLAQMRTLLRQRWPLPTASEDSEP